MALHFILKDSIVPLYDAISQVEEMEEKLREEVLVCLRFCLSLNYHSSRSAEFEGLIPSVIIIMYGRCSILMRCSIFTGWQRILFIHGVTNV